MIINHEENKVGRDFIVGDIHNSITKLLTKLERVGFDHEKDRLFSVGDLFDRGKDIQETIDFFLAHNNKSFFPVIGNHELMLIDTDDGYMEYQFGVFEMNGGDWYHDIDEDTRNKIVDEVRNLPYVRTVVKDGKTYSISHSEISPDYENSSEEKLKALTWSRRMWKYKLITPENITSCFIGHTIFPEVKISGKYINLDTGSFLDDGDVTLWEL